MPIRNIEFTFPIDPEFVLDEIDVSDILDYLGQNDFLDEISIADIVEHLNHETLLDEIGKDLAIEYFEIKVAD